MNRDGKAPNDPIIRAFAAIELPDFIRSFLRDLQGDLKKHLNRGASWPEPSTMHLTLAFLGDIFMSRVPDILHCMAVSIAEYQQALFNTKNITCQGSALFSLSVGGIGFFPSVKNIRVLWTGVKGHTDQLEMLASIFLAQLAAAGFKIDNRPFKPHITLARIKHPVPAKKIIPVFQNVAGRISDEFAIDTITLFKSQLTPSGAVHTKLGSTKI